MIPFLQLETLQPDALLSIANYLRAEVATLEHNIQYMLGQYKLAYSKLEEANRVRLAKLGLENTPMAEDQPADSTTAAPVAGSSSSTWMVPWRSRYNGSNHWSSQGPMG